MSTKVSKKPTKKAVKRASHKRPLASDAEYMRRRRLMLNPDVYARIGIKAKHYLTVKQAEQVERMIDELIGAPPLA